MNIVDSMLVGGTARQSSNEGITLSELSICDLRKDHDRVRGLLDQFERSAEANERRDLMRLAMDLFQVHCALERQLYQVGTIGDAQHWIAHQARRLAAIDCKCRLYRARGLELKHAVDNYLAVEEYSQPSLIRQQLCLDHDNRNLLLLRSLLIEKIRNPSRFH